MNGMVSCKNCMSQNSLDSAFCKKCGTTLPADDVQLAKEKLEAAVADGFKIFSNGRTDEAFQIAETAVRANPQSTTALSLKALCHERVGQISEALECHERVLEIDPDSVIDKIKANDLRNLLVARSSIAAVPDRRMAIVGAVAAFVLVASIGVVIARNGAAPVASKQPIQAPTNEAVGARFESSVTPPGAPKNVAAKTPEQPEDTPVTNNQAVSTPPAPRNDARNDVQLPAAGNTLPAPTGDIGGGNGTQPLRVEPSEELKRAMAEQNKNRGSESAGGNSNPSPQPNRPQDPDPRIMGHTPPTQEAPGIMDIKVVSRNGKTTPEGANDPGMNVNGVEALLRTARNQYQLGNYPSAATSYERALRAGADPASANQRLAQCYEKLNRNSEAVAAYNRAIAAMEADLNGGRGEKERLSAGIDSCRQAIKVLGG